MYIPKVGIRAYSVFGLKVSQNSSKDFRFFSEEFIKGGYPKVFNNLYFIKHSYYDKITFSDCYDFIYSPKSNISPYFFYNFNDDKKIYKLNFPPLRKKHSVKFPIEEIKQAFCEYKTRQKNTDKNNN